MIITKYVVLILSSSVFEATDWFMEVVAALGSLVASIDDVVWMIDKFVRDIGVDLVGKISGELEGADVAVEFNAIEGSVPVIGLSVGSIVESSLQVLVNVVEIDIGSSVIIL